MHVTSPKLRPILVGGALVLLLAGLAAAGETLVRAAPAIKHVGNAALTAPGTALVAAMAPLNAEAAAAQYQYRRGRRRMPARYPDPNAQIDGSFIFARVEYTSVRGEPLGTGWTTDYPEGDRNFMRRFEEFTTSPVAWDDGYPDHVVVTLYDEELFKYPFIFMSDVGTLGLDSLEVERLREYLLRGGFLWVDDFWGWRAWDQWQAEISSVLPPDEYPILDVAIDHPIRQMLYPVDDIPQIPSNSVVPPVGRLHDVGARQRVGNPAPARHQRRERPHHGADVAQYRHRRRLGARERGLRLLQQVLVSGVCCGDQRHLVRPVPLTTPGRTYFLRTARSVLPRPLPSAKLLLAALACAVALGCPSLEIESTAAGAEVPAEAGFALFDERPTNVPVREYPHAPVGRRAGRLVLVPDLVIGERPGEPQYAFGELPPTVALHDDGRIFVYDPSNTRVKVFDAAGEFLYGFGGRGQGPGEFNRDRRSPIGFLGDRLFLFFAYRQLGFWTPEGQFIEPAASRVDEDRMVALDDGTFVGTDFMNDDRFSSPSRSLTLARFALENNGLRETQRYALLPVWMQPNFAARRDGTVYVTGINGWLTEVAAFAPDAQVRWITRFLWRQDTTIMASDLLLDGNGKIYVIPRLNRIELPTTPVDRAVDILAPTGELLASTVVRDFRAEIAWQQARDGFVYGVAENPETFEWEVVRYRLSLPGEDEER